MENNPSSYHLEVEVAHVSTVSPEFKKDSSDGSSHNSRCGASSEAILASFRWIPFLRVETLHLLIGTSVYTLGAAGLDRHQQYLTFLCIFVGKDLLELLLSALHWLEPPVFCFKHTLPNWSTLIVINTFQTFNILQSTSYRAGRQVGAMDLSFRYPYLSKHPATQTPNTIFWRP